jgi:hypothetical protein
MSTISAVMMQQLSAVIKIMSAFLIITLERLHYPISITSKSFQTAANFIQCYTKFILLFTGIKFEISPSLPPDDPVVNIILQAQTEDGDGGRAGGGRHR